MTHPVAVELRRVFHVEEIDRDDLEAQVDALMEALLDLEDDGFGDSAVGVDLGRAIVDVEVVGRGDSFDEALAKADSSIRAAIHAIGGATPGWVVLTTSQHAELLPA